MENLNQRSSENLPQSETISGGKWWSYEEDVVRETQLKGAYILPADQTPDGIIEQDLYYVTTEGKVTHRFLSYKPDIDHDMILGDHASGIVGSNASIKEVQNADDSGLQHILVFDLVDDASLNEY